MDIVEPRTEETHSARVRFRIENVEPMTEPSSRYQRGLGYVTYDRPFLPKTGIMIWKWDEPRQAWELTGFSVSGPQILKGGKPGQRTGRRNLMVPGTVSLDADLPDELRELVTLYRPTSRVIHQ